MFEPIVHQENMLAAVWRRFGLYLFEGKVTVEDMARMEANGVDWLKRNPGRLVEMVVIFPSTSRMTGEERTRMARVIRRWENARVASATVILATDMLGSVQRSVLTGLQLIAPPPNPTKVFGTTAQAVEWLAPYIADVCGVDATYTKVVSGVHEACELFKRRL